jgi:hypothetical protein
MDVHVTPAAQPAAGTTKIGDLYVSQSSKEIWLGVDTSVNINGTVLISDIDQITLDIADCLADAKAYTDTELSTGGPANTGYALRTSPNLLGIPLAPTAALGTRTTQLATTAFVGNAIDAIPEQTFLRGMIMLWWGSLASVNNLIGWVLCDGRTHIVGGVSVTAPDLRDRFIIGAGNLAAGTKKTPVAAETNDHAGHKHNITPVALSVAQMPAHTHTVTGRIDTTATGTNTKVYTGWVGNHSHPVTGYNEGGGGPNNVLMSQSTGSTEAKTVNTGNANYGVFNATTNPLVNGANHRHDIDIKENLIDGVAATRGSGTEHGHGMDFGASAHKHTIQPSEIKDAINYYALAYIMKL